MTKAIKLMSGAAIDKGIEDVIARGNTLGKDIHKFAVQALLHAEKHGDPRKVDRLFKGMHKALRPQAFKVWVETYSPIRWNGDGKVGILKSTAKAFKPFDCESANADPYWNPAENVGKPLTLEALRAMVGQMAKKLAKVDEGKLDLAEGENVVVMRNYIKRMQEADEVAARVSAQIKQEATPPAKKRKARTEIPAPTAEQRQTA